MRPRKHNLDLPTSVYLKHKSYYFVTKKGRWINLGKTRHEMYANLEAAKLASPTKICDEKSARLKTHLKLVYSSCKTRAKKLGVEFSISFGDVEYMLRDSDWRCAITGHGFSFDRFGNTLKRPFVPSIDRIDSSIGYVPGNCRVVCSLVNIAMNAWGEAPLLAVIQSGSERYIAQNLARALDTSNSGAD